MGTRVEQSSEFLPRASRTSRRHLEDMADSLHRLPSAAEDLQLIIPRCNRTLLLQGEFCITLCISGMVSGSTDGVTTMPSERVTDAGMPPSGQRPAWASHQNPSTLSKLWF